jgi:hypothetical protein
METKNGSHFKNTSTNAGLFPCYISRLLKQNACSFTANEAETSTPKPPFTQRRRRATTLLRLFSTAR